MEKERQSSQLLARSTSRSHFFHSPFLTLSAFVSLWPNCFLLTPAEHLLQAWDVHAAGELSQIGAGGLLGFSRRGADR